MLCNRLTEKCEEDERMGHQRMKKSTSFEVFPKFLHYGNFACGEYTHTLRLKSKLFDLRVGYANPSVCGVAQKKESSISCDMLLSFLVTHPGIEPEFPA